MFTRLFSKRKKVVTLATASSHSVEASFPIECLLQELTEHFISTSAFTQCSTGQASCPSAAFVQQGEGLAVQHKRAESCVCASEAAGNCARTVQRQRCGSRMSQEGLLTWIWMWPCCLLALLCHRNGVGPLHLLGSAIKNHCFNTQPTSPLRTCLPSQKKFQQKL